MNHKKEPNFRCNNTFVSPLDRCLYIQVRLNGFVYFFCCCETLHRTQVKTILLMSVNFVLFNTKKKKSRIKYNNVYNIITVAVLLAFFTR